MTLWKIKKGHNFFFKFEVRFVNCSTNTYIILYTYWDNFILLLDLYFQIDTWCFCFLFGSKISGFQKKKHTKKMDTQAGHNSSRVDELNKSDNNVPFTNQSISHLPCNIWNKCAADGWVRRWHRGRKIQFYIYGRWAMSGKQYHYRSIMPHA